MKLVKKTVSVLFHLIILIMLTNCGAYVRHQVKSGETLYAIGWRYDIDHEELAEWNDIPPPYLIHEGQWIRLSSPIASLEQSEPARKQDKKHIIRKPISKGQPKTSEQQTHAKTIRESKKPLAVAVISQSNIEWQWPTKGKVTKYFSSSVQAKRGIDIEGIRGQDIVAAASGTVVYGGSGLIGLGKLVIQNRKARIGRNPQTGEEIKIPAKRVLKFRIAKACKDSVLAKK